MSRLDFGVIFKVLEVRKRLDFLYFELELTSRHPDYAFHFVIVVSYRDFPGCRTLGGGPVKVT